MFIKEADKPEAEQKKKSLDDEDKRRAAQVKKEKEIA